MAFSQRQAGAKVAAASKTCYLEPKSGDGNSAVAPRCKDAKNGKGRNYNSNHDNNNNNNNKCLQSIKKMTHQ